jgi:Zn finger protein HypA/HybF involved in hydrogenase expression
MRGEISGLARIRSMAYCTVRLTCLECGRVFKRSLSRMHGVHCPKCKSADLELSA